MSTKAMVWAWDFPPSKSPAAKLIHVRLAYLADNDGVVTESYAGLASGCGLTVDTVKVHIDSLIARGGLERVTPPGGRRPPTYRVLSRPLEQPPLKHPVDPQVVPPKISPLSTDSDEGDCLSLSSKENKFSLGLDELGSATPIDPFAESAHRLTVFAFEQVPRPVTAGGFPAVLARIKDELVAGTTEELIRAAILAGGVTWSANGLRTALNQARRNPTPQQTEEPEYLRQFRRENPHLR